MPALLKAEKIAEVVREVLDSLEETSPLTKREEGIASSLACHSAIRAGQPLSLEEQRELVRQLEQTCSPHTCPHGRPTMIHLSSKQLEKGFGRI
jgi:DNA mismatch repair protein MutL